MSGRVDGLSAALDGIVGALGSGLVFGTVLAVITGVAVATVLRRVGPALIAALWTIVLVKFLVPVGPGLPVSINGAVERLMGASPAEATSAGAATTAATVAVATDVAGGISLSWLALKLALVLAYLVIVATIIARHIAVGRRLRREVAALEPAGAEVTAAIASVAAMVGLRRPPPARVSDAAQSPYLVGVARPVVVVPRWLSSEPVRLEAAMLHELAHLRRLDPLLRVLQLGVGALLFFWPVVAWVNRRLDRAREMACDQWAVSRGPLGAREYARLLLDMARRGRAAAPVGALALVGRAGQLEARVESLLGGRTRPRLGRPGAGALALWALVSLGGSASAAGGSAVNDCDIDAAMLDRILEVFPDADQDGDGELSMEEACDHQRELRRRLMDEVAVSWMDPLVERAGNGVLGDAELATIKTIALESVPPAALTLENGGVFGQICDAPTEGAAVLGSERRICEKQGE